VWVPLVKIGKMKDVAFHHMGNDQLIFQNQLQSAPHASKRSGFAEAYLKPWRPPSIQFG
jgi:hypothetical protein